MPAITYRPSTAPGITRVYRGRRIAGRILPVYGDDRERIGYRYVPNIGPRGETFATVEQVKASIEGRVPHGT